MLKCHARSKMDHSFSEEQYQERQVTDNGLGEQYPRSEHERMCVTYTHFFWQFFPPTSSG